ncbi:MAG: magnesium transporter [Sebaldella sp.]|nr:magnesium transporter [Sebaldella sp.]
MEEKEKEEIEEITEEIVKIHSKNELEEYLKENHFIDIAESFEDLNDNELKRILNLMSDESKAKVIEQADEELQEKILEMFSDEVIIQIFSYMSPDDITDILGYIDFQKSKSILNKMKRSDANKLRELLGYEEDTAGGIMTTRYIAFKETLLIKDIMAKIKVIAPKTEVIEKIFVLNSRRELIGEADLRDILISPDEMELSEITNENILSVYPEDDQEDVARTVSKYDLKVIPVINKRNHLLGIITVDDIIDVILEESTEDMLKLGGVSEEENINSLLFFSIRKRLPWLIVNLGTAFFASFVVGLFQGTISKAVVLATAMPIVAGMGGNAGTQSLTVTIRGIALGELDLDDNYKIIVKQLLVGLFNGSMLGLITGFIMFIVNKNIFLGIIIFFAMIGNLTIACLTGFIIPVTLKKLKIDPALASAVVLTTFTDVCGFFLFLGLAQIFIQKLI